MAQASQIEITIFFPSAPFLRYFPLTQINSKKDTLLYTTVNSAKLYEKYFQYCEGFVLNYMHV